MEFKHKSVLLDETVGGLNIKPDGIYVDGTLGGAGHAIEVCRKLSAKGRFIGIDQDQDAIIAASERLSAFNQVTIIRSNYCYMADELRSRALRRWTGSCWIWECHLISWIMKREVFPIGTILLWTCEWTEDRAVQPVI